MREEAENSRNFIAQLFALIAEIEALEDQGEVFDTLMGLRDDRRVKDTKLTKLNDLITQAEEEIKMKEAQLEADVKIMVSVCWHLLFDMWGFNGVFGCVVKNMRFERDVPSVDSVLVM
nr:hypothetical protein [Tanacetum cinerariifolium]